MAVRRLVTTVAFLVLLGGPSAGPSGVVAVPPPGTPRSDAVAELDAGLDAMRTLSIHRGRLNWADMRAAALTRLAAYPNAGPADADRVLAEELPRLGDHHSSLLTPAEAAAS